MAIVEIWPIYDELEMLDQAQEAISALLMPGAEPNPEKLALLLNCLQSQRAHAMRRLHDALMTPV